MTQACIQSTGTTNIISSCTSSIIKCLTTTQGQCWNGYSLTNVHHIHKAPCKARWHGYSCICWNFTPSGMYTWSATEWTLELVVSKTILGRELLQSQSIHNPWLWLAISCLDHSHIVRAPDKCVEDFQASEEAFLLQNVSAKTYYSGDQMSSCVLFVDCKSCRQTPPEPLLSPTMATPLLCLNLQEHGEHCHWQCLETGVFGFTSKSASSIWLCKYRKSHQSFGFINTSGIEHYFDVYDTLWCSLSSQKSGYFAEAGIPVNQ